MTFSTKALRGIIYLSYKDWNRDQDGMEAATFSHILCIPYCKTKLIHQNVRLPASPLHSTQLHSPTPHPTGPALAFIENRRSITWTREEHFLFWTRDGECNCEVGTHEKQEPE